MSTTSLTSAASDRSGNTSSASLNEVISFDKCPRCFAQFDFLKRSNGAISKIPLILPCKHVLCEDCIRKISNNQNETLICPICRDMTLVPRQNLDRLTELFVPHYALIGYLVWTKNSTSRKCFTLVSTGVTLKNKQCGDGFDDFIPDDTMLSDLNVGEDLSFKFENCPKHLNEFLNIFCENCDLTVCAYCFLEDHSGHKPDNLYKLSDSEMGNVEELKGKAAKVINQLQLSQRKIVNLKSHDLSYVDNDITTYFSHLFARLHLAEKKLHSQLATHKIGNLDLTELNCKVHSSIVRIRKLLQCLDTVHTKSVNMRVVFEEIQTIIDFPCRLTTSQGQLEPIVLSGKEMLEDIEEHIQLVESSELQYELLPIEDWESVDAVVNFPAPRAKTQKKVQPVPDTWRRPKLNKIKDEDITHRVQVTHVNDLNSFFVQKISVQQTLNSIIRFLKNRSKHVTNANEFILGKIYRVMYISKNKSSWRRGKLIEIVKSQDSVLYNILFIDYGNTQMVTMDRLHYLDARTAARSPCALECKLKDCEQVDFDESTRDHFVQVISDKELFLKVVRKLDSHVQEVELSALNANGELVCLIDLMKETELTPTNSPEVLVLSSAKDCKLFQNSEIFSSEQELRVIVSHAVDPFRIFIQTESNIHFLYKMTEEITAFYESKYTTSIPVDNAHVIVKYQNNNAMWHRAKVISVNIPNKQAEVHFVDWGGNATVSWSSIRTLIENFTKVECQAIEVKLAHIVPKSNEWCLGAIELLKEEFSKRRKWKMLVSKEKPLEVALFRPTSDSDICLNALLVERNYAISTGTLSQVVYWPRHYEVEEIKEEDDDLASSMIKKAEDYLTEMSDPDLKVGLRQQIHIVRYEDPNLIYFTFASTQNLHDDMRKELQIHYSTEKERKKNWKPSQHCVVFYPMKKNFFRGVIKAKHGINSHVVYLPDLATETIVPISEIYVLVPYFERYPCFTYKCCLEKMKPAGDTGKWSQLALEILAKIFSTYKTLHIKLTCSHREEGILGVIMFYSFTSHANALEPSKVNLISINRSLVFSGVAFSSLAPMRIEPPKLEPVKEISSDEEPDKKLNWYDMVESEETLQNTQNGWPQGPILETKEFSAVLTCVDSEGFFYVRDKEMKEMYTSLEENVKSTFSAIPLSPEVAVWSEGDMCTIFYQNCWYRGTVLDVINSKKVSVEMIDFGSEHVVSIKHLRKSLMYPDVPPLVHKIKIYDLYPTSGECDQNYVDAILSMVNETVYITIVEGLGSQLPSAEIYLENGASLNNVLVEMYPEMFMRYICIPEIIEKHETECENDEQIEIEPLTYTYGSLPEGSISKMYISSVWNYNNIVLNVLNTKKCGDSQDLVELMAEINEHADEQLALDTVTEEEPCICQQNTTKEWSRVLIYNTESIKFNCVVVLFVDYGVVEMVNISTLKKIKPEWLKLPVYHRLATVHFELVAPSLADSVFTQMNRLCHSSANVRIISESPLYVHLYDDDDEKEELCYENLVNSGMINLL